MLIKAVNGALEQINHDVEITGDAQEALNQLLRIKSIHKIVHNEMLYKKRIHELNGKYVVDWGNDAIFNPDANVVYSLIYDIKTILRKDLNHEVKGNQKVNR